MKIRPPKKLVVRLKQRAGRSSSGRISVRHRGGGVKKLYRLVDFSPKITGKVLFIEYDPYRSARIARLEHEGGDVSYVIAPHKIKEGDIMEVGDKVEVKSGNRMLLKNIPVGTAVYNVEIEKGRGGCLVRSAGVSAKILAQDNGYTHLEMPSKEVRKVNEDCYASIGQVSCPEHRFKKIKNAGRSRKMGRRPVVRGSAMNPCDHPHGGGEGRTGIGLKAPKTFRGKLAMGVKTRNRKKWTNKLILKRRKK
jgi:large subunit ribosomal protein L2